MEIKPTYPVPRIPEYMFSKESYPCYTYIIPCTLKDIKLFVWYENP